MCSSCLNTAMDPTVIGAGAVASVALVRTTVRSGMARLGLGGRRPRVERDADVAAFLLGLGLDPTECCDLDERVAAGCRPVSADPSAVPAASAPG